MSSRKQQKQNALNGYQDQRIRRFEWPATLVLLILVIFAGLFVASFLPH